MGILHPDGAPIRLGRALTETLAIDSLSRIISDAIKAKRTTDGRVDTRDVAHEVMTKMRALSNGSTTEAMIDDSTRVTALARLLTEAIETQQQPGTGDLNMRDVAAHVFAELGRQQR